jgi:uncharacterized DUF497 family protein
MRYEYDPIKSRANKAKHGIDFEEAQELWADQSAVIVNAQSEIEPRFLVIGRICEAFWTAVITCRGEAVRIISVRRSRKNEELHYGKINQR